jgi:hypothetical protein
MNTHDLPPEERAELRSILSQYLADSQGEIAGTNSPDLRTALHRRESLSLP